MNESKTRPTARNKGAAAEPRDGCEAYYDYREEWGNVKRVGWVSSQSHKSWRGMQAGLMLAFVRSVTMRVKSKSNVTERRLLVQIIMLPKCPLL